MRITYCKAIAFAVHVDASSPLAVRDSVLYRLYNEGHQTMVVKVRSKLAIILVPRPTKDDAVHNAREWRCSSRRAAGADIHTRNQQCAAR